MKEITIETLIKYSIVALIACLGVLLVLNQIENDFLFEL